jgi:hypothetical protein
VRVVLAPQPLFDIFSYVGGEKLARLHMGRWGDRWQASSYPWGSVVKNLRDILARFATVGN